jgi:hypothetical protein
MFLMISGGNCFSAVNGPPGMACIKIKVKVIMSHRVTKDETSLFAKNLPIVSLLVNRLKGAAAGDGRRRPLKSIFKS